MEDGEVAGTSGTQRRSTGPITQAQMSSAVSAAMAQSMAEMSTKMSQAMEAYGKGHSDVASCLTTVTQILEDTKKGTKRSSKEEDETDDVVMVEKTIDVKDDGHETIDHEARSLFQKNPNGTPGKWWKKGRFPRVSKPVLGEQLNMEHLMANHISRDTIIKYHDRAEFLEAKHFLSKVK